MRGTNIQGNSWSHGAHVAHVLDLTFPSRDGERTHHNGSFPLA